METVKIRVPSQTGVGYPQTYEYVPEMHCVECGAQTVWRDDNDDYYVGYDFICVTCGEVFNVPFSRHEPERVNGLRKELDISKQTRVEGRSLDTTTQSHPHSSTEAV